MGNIKSFLLKSAYLWHVEIKYILNIWTTALKEKGNLGRTLLGQSKYGSRRNNLRLDKKMGGHLLWQRTCKTQ